MVSIQFQKDAAYHKAVDTGNGREEVKIPAGTVWRGITDATAHRWERRGVAIRIADDFAPAIPPAPPPAVNVEAQEGDGKQPLTPDQFGSTAPSPMGERFARAQAAAPVAPPPPPPGNE